MLISSKKTAGFTLIELMVAVAIVGVLATIAYPSYQSSIRKSKRVDAKNALLSLASLQERWYLKELKYTKTLSDLGSTKTENDYYDLGFSNDGCDAAELSCFVLTATAKGPQAADTECSVFTVNQSGLKKSKDSSGNDTSSICW